MLDDPVRKIIRKSRLLTARPGTRVIAAAGRMAKRNVGAILVVEGGRLVGIITERDIVFRVVARGLDPRAATIAALAALPSPCSSAESSRKRSSSPTSLSPSSTVL